MADQQRTTRNWINSVERKRQRQALPSNYRLPSRMDQYLDLWNLTAYDYVGGWNTTGHQANPCPNPSNPDNTPANTDDTIKFYTSAGVASDKILLGMPLYGRAIVNTTGSGHNGTDVGMGASYSYDSVGQMYVTYDTMNVTKIKAEYIKKKRLGGAMWWETSMDKAGAQSLIATAVTELGGMDAFDKPENLSSFQDRITRISGMSGNDIYKFRVNNVEDV
ncbi:hypothetical protein BBP40_002879 [Aspergillus hancockii]|nr:hypothetical protein BBP40_002879 [Aspergillus hancockii]